jgi:hypothetical protein
MAHDAREAYALDRPEKDFPFSLSRRFLHDFSFASRVLVC